MVMRRVFNHHVCLCVLSTAILAGLALMTSQTKVYAQAQNCKGVVSGGEEDDKSGLIMCDGGLEGSGRDGVLEGDRDIDMNGHSGETAVTITGASTKITIVGPLKVKDSSGGRGDNDTTAIKVDQQGKLTVMNANVGGVKKGIVVSDSGSSVTVVQGSIGVGMGMGPVIEVSKEGKVVLMEDVTVELNGGSEGEVVINNGGDVTLMGTRFDNVTTGIVVKGNGNASVKGGATITVKQGGGGGTGFKMQGQANASATVVDMTINGSGGGGNRTGVEMGSTGTLTMTKVTLEQLETGAKVTKGTLELNGGSKINVGQNGTGLEVTGGTANVANTTITLQGDGSKGLVMKGGTATVMGATITVGQNGTGATGVEVLSGTANVMGATITLQGNRGKGLEVNNGKVTMMGGSITGSGNGMGTTGVEMKGSADVTLTRVEIKEVAKGITMTGGTLTLNGGSKINVKQGGTGLDVSNGTANVANTTITGSGNGMGISVTDGNVTVKGVNISEFTTGITMTGGTLKLDGGSITAGSTGTGTGISATDGSGNVTVKGGATITGFATGINMKGTGTLTVEGGTRINFMGGYGIKVGAGMTEATLTNVTITGSGGGTGVEVKGNANVTLTSVTMREVKTGVEMTGNGAFTVEGGSITGSGSGTGINVIMGGDVTVKGGTRITGFATGVEMRAGKSLTVKEGTTINVKQGGTGVSVGDRVKNTTLTGVRIEGSRGSEKGVEVKGGMVTMKQVDISNVGTGVLMGSSVTEATLTNVTIEGAEKGIAMEGKGTFTVSGTTTINFTGSESYDYGVMVGTSVTKANLTGVTIEGSGTGKQSKGVWVKGGSGNVKLERVNISKVGMGIYAMGGSLTVSGGSIGFTGTYGVMVEKGVTSATLTGVMITGSGNNGMGIYAEGGNLTVIGGEIKGVKTGISMEGKGELKVERVTRIQFMGTYGVMVGDKVTSATLTDVTITGSGGSGVLMMGSTVTMTRVNVSKVETGIYAMGGNLTVIGGEIKEVKTGINMTGTGTLTVKDRTTINFTGDDGYGVSVGGSVTEATLTNVTITGSGNSGVGVYAMGGR
ncbi:right-handed parallel beta-helix repeat-containing protein [Bartonella schoenbuchensis]|uniref:right-handed parallel beta-helix repeat-containing protein n=1 Tax=Bartonella schoenbuchensis TaxID=165694 RepID=UPI0031453EB1